MGRFRSRFGYVSAEELEEADRFLADLQGESSGSWTEQWDEQYRTLDDPTVFQGTGDDLVSPIGLTHLMRLYVIGNDERELRVNARGRELRFTRRWLRGPAGTAILRGRIRYELARQRQAGQATRIEEVLSRLRGDAARIEHLRVDLRSSRTPDMSPILVEVATEIGTNWECRGFFSDNTGTIKAPESDRSCPATATEVERVLRARLARGNEVARRAIWEREHAAEINRIPQGPRRTARIEALITAGQLNPRGLKLRARTSFARLHGAWDIPAAHRTGVYSLLPGRVIEVRTSDTYGKLVRIEHDRLPTPVVTNYCHLDEQLVSRGQRVFAGQAVGLAGATGSPSGRRMGVHLHFSVLPPGRGLSSDNEADYGLDPQAWFFATTRTRLPSPALRGG